jgi:hypothetical protein
LLQLSRAFCGIRNRAGVPGTVGERPWRRASSPTDELGRAQHRGGRRPKPRLRRGVIVAKAGCAAERALVVAEHEVAPAQVVSRSGAGCSDDFVRCAWRISRRTRPVLPERAHPRLAQSADVYKRRGSSAISQSMAPRRRYRGSSKRRLSRNDLIGRQRIGRPGGTEHAARESWPPDAGLPRSWGH